MFLYIGHVNRMDPSRLPKIILYGELANGTRPRGAPKRRYKDQLKRTLAMTNIDPSLWEQTDRDRKAWRRLTHKGTADFEERRSENERARRERRRERGEQRRHPTYTSLQTLSAPLPPPIRPRKPCQI